MRFHIFYTSPVSFYFSRYCFQFMDVFPLPLCTSANTLIKSVMISLFSITPPPPEIVFHLCYIQPLFLKSIASLASHTILFLHHGGTSLQPFWLHFFHNFTAISVMLQLIIFLLGVHLAKVKLIIPTLHSRSWT